MIGILGAYGDIGIHVLRALKRLQYTRVRCGVHSLDKITSKMYEEFPQAEWVQADAAVEKSLASFVNGCSTVLSCVAPSFYFSDKIARVCVKKGCKYVDSGYNERLFSFRNTKIPLVFAAGTSPGLSALLCRYLGGKFTLPQKLTYIIGIMNGFTHGAAWDYLQGITDKNNVPIAAYRNGIMQKNTCFRKQNVQLPLFRRNVNLLPFFDYDSQIVSTFLTLQDADFYLAVDGVHLQNALDKARIVFIKDRESAIHELIKASKLELLDKEKYLNFLIEIHGMIGKQKAVKTLVLSADMPSFLTAVVAATAAIYVEEGKFYNGTYPLSDIAEPVPFVDTVIRTATAVRFFIFDGAIEDMQNSMEGEI